jgi:SAM-dependent methyltransferase
MFWRPPVRFAHPDNKLSGPPEPLHAASGGESDPKIEPIDNGLALPAAARHNSEHPMTTHDPRDLEWQRRYEQNDTPWDKGTVAPPLADYFKTHAITGRVLVPGCGRGHEVRALAAQSNCLVTGLDFAPGAVADATQLTAEAGLSASARFVVGDFFRPLPEMMDAFDWLVEHTCFCAIEPRRRPDYVRAAAAVLRVGGKIFGIFYLTPDVEAGPPFAVSVDELGTLFGAQFAILENWIPTASFPGRESRERVLVLQKR